MTFVWIFYFIEILFFNIIRDFCPFNEILSIFLVFLNSLAVIFIGMFFKKEVSKIFILGFVMRMAILILDIYFRNVILIPHSGNDTEAFLSTAYSISDNLYFLKSPMYGGGFTKFLGIIFNLTAKERILGQYINILLGMSIIEIFYSILKRLDINYRISVKSLALITFIPHSIIFSGILLRENFIIFFSVISLSFLVKWFEDNLTKDFIISLITLIISSSFHSGMISLFSGYAFLYLFYNGKKKKLIFNSRSIVSFLFIALITTIAFKLFNNALTNKFQRLDQFNDIIGIANSRSGGSAYLSGLSINSPLKLIVFSPIFMIYFLSSPLPQNWRGIADIFSFFADSVFYIYFVIYISKNFIKKIITDKPLIIGLLISLFTVVLIFGIGVKNAGTAIRHRQKIFTIFVLVIALIQNENKVKNLENYNKGDSK